VSAPEKRPAAGKVGGFGPSGLDRRRGDRVRMPPSGGPVSVVGARLLNVSPFGMMIESLVPLERDAVLALRLIIGGQKFDVEARVAACTPITGGARRGFGIGLEFAQLPGEVRERLKQVAAGVGEPVKAG